MANIAFGIDLDGLAAHAAIKPTFPKPVKGRRVHIDGDFLAYQCSYEKVDEEKSIDDMIHNVSIAIDTLKGYCAATEATIHLTPKESDKGGRFDIALLKEYQANRQGKEKPRFLHTIREHMHKDLGAVLHMDAEADDGMSIEQYAAIARGEEHLSIIATKDKDLRMVPGLHLVWSTGEIVETDAWGWIKVEDGKMKGFGSKFFWSQCLTGDTADNISGLQLVMPNILNRIDPTKPVTAAWETLKTDPNNVKALRVLSDRQAKPCGPVMAEKILAHVKNDKQAFAVVKACYTAQQAQGYPMLHWRDPAEEIDAGPALVSEMKLLWMRRKKDRNDVIHWLHEMHS